MLKVPKAGLPVRYGKRDPASLFEVGYWVYRGLCHEVATGIGEFLHDTRARDFRGVAQVMPEDTALIDDPLMIAIVVKLHSGQEFRVIIEEK